MEKKEIFERLNQVFQEVFDDPSIQVDERTVASDIDAWDSWEHINFLVSVENCFGIEFSMAEVSDLDNVGEMVDIIQNRLAEKEDNL